MTTTTLTNDDRIILLKQKIEDKRTALKGANTRPRLITNCQLTMDGIKYNLHTGGDTLTLLYLKLNALRMSAYDLQIDQIVVHLLDGLIGALIELDNVLVGKMQVGNVIVHLDSSFLSA